MFNQDTSALILIDYQTRLLPSIQDGENAVACAIFLAQVAKHLEIPVFGTEQNPVGLGHNDERIKVHCDQTFLKLSFDASADGLAKSIQAKSPQINQLILGGCETHVCLMQSALGLQEKGFEVGVVAEACGSRKDGDKELALERLKQHGIQILSPEIIAFEWLRSSDHPQFKKILQLIKHRS